MWENSVVTNIGKALLASWAAGATFNLDSAKGGTGTVLPINLRNQTGLVSEKQTLSLLGYEAVAGGIRVKVRVVAHPTAGYTLNQIGIWGSIDGGTSTLMALYQDATGIPIPAATDIPDFAYTFYATIQMANDGTMSITIDTAALITMADLTASLQIAIDAEASTRANADAIRPTMTTADITYYVNTVTGNDANNGLTAGTAFKTVQKAIDTVPKVVNHTVHISIAAGTYAEDVKVAGFVGSGNLYIDGDLTGASLTTFVIQGIMVIGCTCYVSVTGITAITTTGYAFYANVSTYVGFFYCVTTIAAATRNGIVILGGTKANVDHCIISNKQYGLYTLYDGKIYSNANTGVGNVVGVIASSGGVIHKSGTQPVGTTTEAVTTGGLIVDVNGIPINVPSLTSGRVPITASSDLNSYTTPGNYTCDSAVTAATLTNTGWTSSAFDMEVSTPAGGIIIQKIRPRIIQGEIVRSYATKTAATWEAWAIGYNANNITISTVAPGAALAEGFQHQVY